MGIIEMLGAHQGERLISDEKATTIDVNNEEDRNLANDISLINVALFWNTEIGENGNGSRMPSHFFSHSRHSDTTDVRSRLFTDGEESWFAGCYFEGGQAIPSSFSEH